MIRNDIFIRIANILDERKPELYPLLYMANRPRRLRSVLSHRQPGFGRSRVIPARSWVGLSLSMVGSAEAFPSSDVAASLTRVQEVRDRRVLSYQSHRFPACVARDQVLDHAFQLRNASAIPVRLSRGTALVPCCSSIRSMPDSIEPGGVGEVAVSLKAGRSTGRRTVAFTVETDSPERPQIHLELSADLYAEWEVSSLTATPLKLPPGRSGEIEMKLGSRKDGKDG